MALGTSGNKIYLGISDGKVVQKVKEGTPGAQSRAKKDGSLVWELRYSYIAGIITGISVRNSTYAGQEIKEWQFEIVDGNDSYQLQIMYDSRYATSLLNALANPVVDFSAPITITPWMKVVADKKKTSCYVKQGDRDISWYFTQETPNGLPDLKQVTFRGKESWDSYDRMQFFEKYVETRIKPQLIGSSIAALTSGAPVSAGSDFGIAAGPTPEYADLDALNTSQPEDDDLPF